MSRGLMVLLLVLGGLVVAALIFGFMAIGQYNRAIALNANVEKAWADVDSQLMRRYDLIPNLVETVRGYAEHEREIFTNIAEARTRYFSAQTPEDKIGASQGIERALSRLLMLQEQYPQLRASEQFRDLMVALEGTENRINIARMRYNEAVRQLNTFVRSFFGRIFAGWAGVEEAEYFEVEPAARVAPRVDFGRGETERAPSSPAPESAPSAPAPAPDSAPSVPSPAPDSAPSASSPAPAPASEVPAAPDAGDAAPPSLPE